MLSLLPGVLLLWCGFVVVPAWLGVEGPDWLDPPWLGAQMLWLALIAWMLDGLLRYLYRPVPSKVAAGVAPDRGQAARSHQSASLDWREIERDSGGVRRSLGRLGRWRVRAEKPGTQEQQSDQSSDIMIELD
jgi:hypothetical protein